MKNDVLIVGDVAFVALTQGQTAAIDAADWPLIKDHKWFAWWRREAKTYYAMTNIRVGQRKYSTESMHRMVLGIPRGVGHAAVVHHWDHNGLNSRRANIQSCTNAQNSRHSRPKAGRRSAYKGLYQQKWGSWTAYVTCNGKAHYLGTFRSEKAAAEAYDAGARAYFGEFAFTNF